MARNTHVIFLNDLGASELGGLIPAWVKEVVPFGSYLLCHKAEAGDRYLTVLVDSVNSQGQSVEFDMRIPGDYVRAIMKVTDLARIGILGIH